jgi:hypothetical protein
MAGIQQRGQRACRELWRTGEDEAQEASGPAEKR